MRLGQPRLISAVFGDSTVGFRLVGAPPQTRLRWSSLHDGQLTREYLSDYGHRTDKKGEWSGRSDPMRPGRWVKVIVGEGFIALTDFRV